MNRRRSRNNRSLLVLDNLDNLDEMTCLFSWCLKAQSTDELPRSRRPALRCSGGWRNVTSLLQTPISLVGHVPGMSRVCRYGVWSCRKVTDFYQSPLLHREIYWPSTAIPSPGTPRYLECTTLLSGEGGRRSAPSAFLCFFGAFPSVTKWTRSCPRDWQGGDHRQGMFR